MPTKPLSHSAVGARARTSESRQNDAFTRNQIVDDVKSEHAFEVRVLPDEQEQHGGRKKSLGCFRGRNRDRVSGLCGRSTWRTSKCNETRQ